MADRQTILIVDDEMDMRIFMSTLFETSGYHPVVARDGRQGLDLARKVQPDLIIMDVMMPGEGGALMYKNIKSDPDLCHIPVIMLSAVNETSFRYYLRMLNIQLAEVLPDPEAYMEKPPDPELLLRLTRQIIPQQQAPA
jgi:two-component system phosphate regulon response regulator PhoB